MSIMPIDAHLAHLARLGRRPGTIYQRRCTLNRLAAWLHPRPLLDADVDDLRAFTARPTHGPAAQRAEVAHLRGFYRWAVLEGLRVDDPTIRLERPAVPTRFPRPMPDELVTFVLANAPARLSPWFHLAAYAGLRACEIGPLRGEDIVGDSIIVRDQKGGGEGAVPLAAPLRAVLEGLPRAGWLFPHRGRGAPGPTSAAQVSKLANLWLKAEGIQHSLHSLRHWYGTHAYRAGHDLRMAQRLLRHRSVSTTVLYTAVDDGEAAATVALLPDLTEAGTCLVLDQVDELEDDVDDYDGLVEGLIDRCGTALALASAYSGRPALDTAPRERELLLVALCGVERALDALEGGY